MWSLRRCCSISILLGWACLGTSRAAADGVQPPLRDTIDGQVRAAWEQQKIKPAPPASDAAILRRLYLDLVGTIPTHDEACQFLDDKDPTKREKLIDRLLNDPRFARQQMMFWDQVLFGRNPPNGEAVRKRDLFRNWLAGKFEKNVPYDHWVRDLLLAEEDGSELYYVQFNNKPEDLTEAFSKQFLGTQLQCTRCHDHPFTNLKQKDFYGMAGFFVRLVVLDQGAVDKRGKRFRIGEKSTGDVLFAGNMKELKPGNKGEPVKPKFLAGAPLEEPALPKNFKETEPKSSRGMKEMPKPVFSRKEKLAEWATSPTNPFFAKAAVNRLWGQFMGRGIVHPVDNLGDDNKPTLPALFDTLAERFIAHKFDTKWLIRELVSSRTYQLAATGEVKDALPRLFERGRIRPLTAEELQAVMIAATGFDAKLGESVTGDYFVRYFGEPTNGQGEFQGSLGEHLFLNNSSSIRTFITRRKGNLADAIAGSKEPWEQRVDRMFLSVLTRLPDEAEKRQFVTCLTSDPKTDAVVEEAIWVLMNTSEFRFNH
jgi:hypothetical protein